MSLLKLQSLLLTNAASNRPHLLSLPKQSHQLRTSISKYEPLEVILIQTATVWECSLVTEHIPSMCEALGSSSSAIQKRQKVNWLVSGGFPLNKMEYEEISYNFFRGNRNGLIELHSVG